MLVKEYKVLVINQLGSLKTMKKIDPNHLNSLDFFLDPPIIVGDSEKE
jgi:hypothetical protein